MELQPSWRPGFHGLSLSEDTAKALGVVADLMIPGGEGYPAASEAQVVGFVEAHLNPSEQDRLEKLLGDLNSGNREEVGNWLRELEASSSGGSFAFLRWYVYCAYYSSPSVLAALRDRGYDYHGSPQPYGYKIEADPPVPTEVRGSYIPTEEVKNVFGRE